MADLRERFATAGSPRSTWGAQRGDEQSVLGALGMADELGAALWRLKYKGDPRVAKRCVALMAARLDAANAVGRRPGRLRRPQAAEGRSEAIVGMERLAFRVIYEWVNDRCTVCHGRGTTGALGHVRACGHCKGSCREPLNHVARARDLGVNMVVYHQAWEWRLGRLLMELDALDEVVRGTVRAEIKPVEGVVLNLTKDHATMASNADENQSAA